MKYYAIYDTETGSLSKAQVKCLNDEVENIEVSKTVYDNFEKYIYSNGEILENPEYENDLLEKECLKQVNEIKQKLRELDLKSIRAIRANESDYLAKYETQAVELRAQLAQLNADEK